MFGPMLDFLDLSLPTPEENLACDEALLEWAERENPARGVLRVWESPRPFVVVGFGGRISEEVCSDFCRTSDLPILRRETGGGSVLQGPGCLNVSLILPMALHRKLGTIQGSNEWILGNHVAALRPLLGELTMTRGLSDLTLDTLKFSGNAQRRKRRWLLFHGTILRDLDLQMVDRSLAMPPRQPDYRLNRPHLDFIRNTSVSPEMVKKAMASQWKADGQFMDLSMDRVTELARTRYSDHAWNFRFV